MVPVYSFNENDTYDIVNDKSNPWVKRLQNKFQAVFGISLPIVLNIFPKACNITTVVGKPLPVEKIEDPTQEQVQEVLDAYMDSVQELFESNYQKYNANPKENNLLLI